MREKILILFLFLICSCANKEDVKILYNIEEYKVKLKNENDLNKYIPKNLAESIAVLDLTLSDKDKQLLIENDPRRYHHAYGQYLRNNWGLWGDSELCKYFNNLGVNQADDMSGIILASYKRYLKKEPIELNEQIKKSKEWYDNYSKKLHEKYVYHEPILHRIIRYIWFVLFWYVIFGIPLTIISYIKKFKYRKRFLILWIISFTILLMDFMYNMFTA